MIRCISLWQPWAELKRRGLKEYETRSWAFPPGPLAIHAARKKFFPFEHRSDFIEQLRLDGVDMQALDYGAVLCIVDVIAAHKTERVRDQLSERERLYGDYDDGRFAMQTRLLRVLDQPFPLIGHQGLFGWAEGDRYLTPTEQISSLPLFGGVGRSEVQP